MMSPELKQIRQLVLAKSLYLHGCTHALGKDDVSRMVAVHHFDNAIEMVLRCAVIEEGKVPEKYFEQLLGQLDGLALTDQMKNLHRLRNTVQHSGDIPSLDSVIKYKGYAEDFFIEVCDKVFSIPYDKLCLSELIENEKLKEQVRIAEEAFGKAEFTQCIELCDGAFISATFDEADVFYSAGMLTGYWGASEELKKVLSKDYVEKYRDTDHYELARELRGAIIQWGQAATGMQFLEEHRMDFLTYRRIAETAEQLSASDLKDGAQFCLHFVTTVILKWQEQGLFGLEDSNR